MVFKKMMVAVDFSAPSQYALQVAAGLAAENHAALVIVHVWQAPVAPYGAGLGLESGGDVIDNLTLEGEKALSEWKREAEVAGAKTVGTTLVVGTPWNEIVQMLAQDEAFDLAILGTHGRTGLAHAFLGSVAEKVVRHAPCAVLVVRQRA